MSHHFIPTKLKFVFFRVLEEPFYQGCQSGTILGAKDIFLLHKNLYLALKLIQTGNPAFLCPFGAIWFDTSAA